MIIALEKISLEEFLNLPETKPAQEYINDNIYQKNKHQGKHSRLQKIGYGFEPHKLPEIKYNNEQLTILNVL